jgi:hypothetical protein
MVSIRVNEDEKWAIGYQSGADTPPEVAQSGADSLAYTKHTAQHKTYQETVCGRREEAQVEEVNRVPHACSKKS